MDRETLEKFNKANAANIAKKLKEGKTLSSAEAKMLEKYQRESGQAEESKAKKIISEGLFVMRHVADIIEKSKLTQKDKAAIRQKILALNEL